jgi:hypothetical protein
MLLEFGNAQHPAAHEISVVQLVADSVVVTGNGASC